MKANNRKTITALAFRNNFLPKQKKLEGYRQDALD